MIAEGGPRELIAAHIEAQVIEAYGENALAWGEAHGRRLSDRFEITTGPRGTRVEVVIVVQGGSK